MHLIHVYIFSISPFKLGIMFLFSVAELCHSLTNYLVEQRQPLKGIVLLQKAISKLRLFDSQLTSIHADLCHLCLLAKCFKPALQLLDIDITGICQEVCRKQIEWKVEICFISFK